MEIALLELLPFLQPMLISANGFAFLGANESLLGFACRVSTKRYLPEEFRLLLPLTAINHYELKRKWL